MTTQLQNYAGKAATVGATGYAMGRMLRGNQNLALPGGRTIPFGMFAGGATALGSLTSDVMHDTVIPHILKSERFSDAASAAVAGGTSIGTMYAAAAATDPRIVAELGLLNMVGLALGAEAVGGYVWHGFVQPMIGA